MDRTRPDKKEIPSAGLTFEMIGFRVLFWLHVAFSTLPVNPLLTMRKGSSNLFTYQRDPFTLVVTHGLPGWGLTCIAVPEVSRDGELGFGEKTSLLLREATVSFGFSHVSIE